MPQTDRRPYALVVDDDPLIRMEAAAILEDGDFRPLEARAADEAMKILGDHDGRVQLLFTDVQMPGEQNGFALARTVAERWAHIRILVASGNAKPEPGDMTKGAIFVGKPFSVEVVPARLRQLLPDDQRPEPLRD